MTWSLTSQVLDQKHPRWPCKMMSQDMTYCWKNILNAVTSLWSQSRDVIRDVTNHCPWPLSYTGSQWPKICYFQQFSRYLAWNITNSWHRHWRHVSWISNTSYGPLTSSVMWPLEAAYVTSRRSSIETKLISRLVFEILSFENFHVMTSPLTSNAWIDYPCGSFGRTVQ